MTSTSASEPTTTICARTGLVLADFPVLGTWRVYKTPYPVIGGRAREGQAPEKWNRFDLPGPYGTVYSATTKRGALAEVLGSLKPRISELAALASDVFDDVDDDEDPISREWDELGHMKPGHIARVWRAERRVAQLHHRTPPAPGAYVHLEHHESIAALDRSCRGLLLARRVEQLDVSVIRGNDRELTCGLAEWISKQYLSDGRIPQGIRYASRHSTEWECWATLPPPPYGHLVEVGDPSRLPLQDIDLQYAASLFGLTFH